MEEKSHPYKVFLVLRVLLGLFFLFVGGQKFFALGDFILSVRSYQILFPPLDRYAAYLVASLEVISGLLLIQGGRLYRGGLFHLLFLCLVFMAALGFAWWRGLEINCGCFGASEKLTNYPLHLLLNAGLAGLILGLLAEHRTWRKTLFRSKRAYTLPPVK